jgi:nitrogenase molybdenum-iron protein alpha chain
MLNLKTSEVQTREQRLGSLSDYSGSPRDIVAQVHEHGKLQTRERCFSQNSGCMSGCTQGHLSAITDACVITHGPIGCSADFMGANNARKWGEFSQGIAHRDVILYSSNMRENDTVFGGIEKLRGTVLAAFHEKHPAAIFITASCVSAIIGEDVQALAEEMSEELGIPVVACSCAGFRSKIWASGFDAAHHAVLYGICKPAQQKTNTVNVINFRAAAPKELTDTLEFLGLKPRLVIGYQTVEELSKMPEAAASVTICGTLGTYLGSGLEQHFGVPYVKALQPHGIAGFEDFLRQLAAVTHTEDRAEAYIKLNRAQYLPQIEAVKQRLKGVRAVIGMGPGFAFNFTRVLQELGIEVIQTFSWHLDIKYDHDAVPESLSLLADEGSQVPVRVNDLQYNEVIGLLKDTKPDLFLYRHPSNAGIIMRSGIPAISLIDEYMGFGYQGLLAFAHTIEDVLANRNFEKKLAAKTKLPYTQKWLDRAGRPAGEVKL